MFIIYRDPSWMYSEECISGLLALLNRCVFSFDLKRCRSVLTSRSKLSRYELSLSDCILLNLSHSKILKMTKITTAPLNVTYHLNINKKHNHQKLCYIKQVKLSRVSVFECVGSCLLIFLAVI